MKKAAFTPTPDWLRTWVEDKDRRYWSAQKHARGILSYTVALKSLEDYFKAIKLGSLKPNQRSIAYFAKAWGWNWTKTLRFFVIVMEALENLDARFQRLKRKAEEYAQRAKEYVYKARGKIFNSSTKGDESEIEKLFLDAMAGVAKNNPAFYRRKIKENLRAGDPATVENFENFKHARTAEEQKRERDALQEKIQNQIEIYNMKNDKKIIKCIIDSEQKKVQLTRADGQVLILELSNLDLLGVL